VLFATLWVAAGSHCRLEAIPGFDFLSCCQHSDTEKDPAHHENECGTDGCAAVESGLYKLSKPQQAPLKPVLVTVPWLVPLVVSCDAPTVSSARSGVFAPSELARSWHFYQRAALLPRAPSRAS
jgi:hypothetical protein